MRRLVLVGALLSVQLFHEVALGCGSTPDVVDRYLPAPDATGVSLDAALFVSTNYSLPTAMTLRRASDEGGSTSAPVTNDLGARDGGGVVNAVEAGAIEADVVEPQQIDVSLTCYAAGGGNFCVGKPTTALSPSTTYDWIVSTPRPGQEGSDRFTDPQRFTTSGEVAEGAEQGLAVAVVKHEYVTVFSPCGGNSSVVRQVSVELTGTGLTGPLLVRAPWSQWPTILTPDAPEQTAVFSDPAECFTLETFDEVGKRGTTEEICPEELLPVAGSPELLVPAPPPTAPTEVTLTTPVIYDTADSGPATDGDELEATSEPSPGDPSAGVRHNAVEGGDSGACAVSPPKREAPSLGMFGLMALGAVAAWRRRPAAC